MRDSFSGRCQVGRYQSTADPVSVSQEHQLRKEQSLLLATKKVKAKKISSDPDCVSGRPRAVECRRSFAMMVVGLLIRLFS